MALRPGQRFLSLLLLLIGLLLVYNPVTKFPYTFCVIIMYILAVTWYTKRSLKPLRFRKLDSKALKIILLSYLVLELSMDFVFQPLVNKIFNEPADYTAFRFIEGDTAVYFSWLLKMWISAAVGEELLFRAFAFAKLRDIFNRRHWVFIPISAVLFSIPHLYQGLAGLTMTFLFGLFFGYIFYRFKNIWINIIVHGLIDTVFLTLSYLGYLEFYSMVW
ncbi:CPBP family intramembrane metalloprotease [Subsaxibacter sp. CAU 1640]|uniref:CPBP family intramembrane glutamic endopeptidase n=1 Tax=Subsaxibacter sp. CAU 1640 TaxID=2933271 RepID=UPI002002A038|nr:CPBP family intramembrane glutamic endopeptidase [Subsaxibacter sp. CAU 1640]MCK7591095.1 CPBP family intramembrane metalloprotease [Subsaxibacter sp. CAU 1640]